MKQIPMWRRIQRMLGPDIAEDAEEELRHHLESRTRELVAAGMDPDAARAEALRRFGDVERVRKEVVEIDRSVERRSGWMTALTDLWQDLRLSVRGLRRRPGFAAAAIMTLSLGVGANLAVFSVVNAVVLRPLPFADPDRLVMLWEQNPEKGWYMETAAPANVLDWRERVDAFADVAAYASFDDRMALTGDGTLPRNVSTKSVTGNFFSVLGVAPEAGRLFRFEDTWNDSAPLAVVSYDLWQETFAGSPEAIGKSMRLNGQDFRIIGVLPEGFRLPGTDAEVWVNMRWDPDAYADPSFRRAHWARAVARLAPGATFDQAAAQLDAVASQLETEFPETNRLMGAGMTPLHEFLLGDVGRTLLIVLAAVGLLLVLACANVGNLLLVQALARQREVAVRRALGAGRWRLVRQTFAESLLLSGIGAVVGVVLAGAILGMLGHLAGSVLPDGVGFDVDRRFAMYLILLIAGSTILFGMIPAIVGSRADSSEAMKEGGRSGGQGRAGRRASNALVAGEVALALILVTGAALLARSFVQLRQVDPGFDGRNVLTASVVLPGSRYETGDAVVNGFAELKRRAEALPGVESVAAVRQLPLTTASWSSDFSIEGRAPDDYGVEALHREVLPGYFDAMGVPLLGGRRFDDTDRFDTEPVIIINQALADQYFAGEDPVGARIAFNRAPTSETTWWTIVGVVGSERQASPTDPARPEIFAPVAQDITRGMTLVLRGTGDPMALAAPLRAAVSDFDPELVLDDLRTMSSVRDEATASQEFLAAVFAGFAGVALVLALVGVYGVMAQAVRARHREIGIRLALGAARFNVLTLIGRYALELLVAGIVAGSIGALLATGSLSTLLYGVAPRDPVTLGATAISLLLVGLGAAAIPAIRAGRTQPAEVLREE